MTNITAHAFRCRIVPEDRMAFHRDVEAGLSAPQKWLPSRYLYDAEGTRLFGEITGRPEYYLTRSETDIIRRHADDIASAAGPGVRVVEIGTGSGDKMKIILDAMLRRHRPVVFSPLDQSETAVRTEANRLLQALNDLIVEAQIAGFDEGLDDMFAEEPEPTLLALLGSSLGNFHREEALAFLSRLRRRARPFDLFLLGLDLRKDERVLNAAYNDAAGATAAFNRNILARINRELGGAFDMSDFEHVARYNAAESRMEMHLRSKRAQAVRVEALDRDFAFDEGETVWTESSYKYSAAEVAAMCALTGWTPMHRWEDPKRYFSLMLLAPAAGRGLQTPRVRVAI